MEKVWGWHHGWQWMDHIRMGQESGEALRLRSRVLWLIRLCWLVIRLFWLVRLSRSYWLLRLLRGNISLETDQDLLKGIGGLQSGIVDTQGCANERMGCLHSRRYISGNARFCIPRRWIETRACRIAFGYPPWSSPSWPSCTNGCHSDSEMDVIDQHEPKNVI
jgi:hypothetical protein